VGEQWLEIESLEILWARLVLVLSECLEGVSG
jgi:hypothetical protein